MTDLHRLPTLTATDEAIFDTTSGRLDELRSQINMERLEASALFAYRRAMTRLGRVTGLPSISISAGWSDYQTFSTTIQYEIACRKDAVSELKDEMLKEMVRVTQVGVDRVAAGLEGATTRKAIMKVLSDLAVVQDSLYNTDYLEYSHHDPSLPRKALEFRLRVRQTIRALDRTAKELHVQATRAYQHLS